MISSLPYGQGKEIKMERVERGIMMPAAHNFVIMTKTDSPN